MVADCPAKSDRGWLLVAGFGVRKIDYRRIAFATGKRIAKWGYSLRVVLI